MITDKRLNRVIYRRNGPLSDLDWAVMLGSYRTGERVPAVSPDDFEDTLRFMIWGSPEEVRVVQSFLEDFKREHPEIDVKVEHAPGGAPARTLPIVKEGRSGYYVQQNKWEGGTPVGGVWDAELNSFGLTSSIGVHFNGTGRTRDDTYMRQIDAAMDDGDLATGSFRKIAGDRYYMVVVE